jgi:hypothetical protein
MGGNGDDGQIDLRRNVWQGVEDAKPPRLIRMRLREMIDPAK